MNWRDEFMQAAEARWQALNAGRQMAAILLLGLGFAVLLDKVLS